MTAFLIFFIFIWFFKGISIVLDDYITPMFSSDNEITTNVVSIGNPSISLIENGFFVAVWSNHLEIRGQIYDMNGKKYGSELTISSYNSYFQDNPSVAMLNDESFFVVWESYLQDGDGSGIFGQFFYLTEKIGTQLQINTIILGDQKYPTISGSGSYFVVVWQGPDNSENGIYARIYDNIGQDYGSEFLVNENYQNDQSHPSVDLIAINQYNGNILYFVVTWMSYGQEYDPDYGIYARKFSSFINNTISFNNGKEFLVNNQTNGNQTHPKISLKKITDSSFIYVIVWESLGKAKGRTIINTQKSHEFIINNPLNNLNQYLSPSVSISNLYGFIVVYQHYVNTNSNYDIFAQNFSFYGNKIGNEFQINSYLDGDQKNPIVKSNNQGHFVVAWISQNMDSLGNALNFQILDNTHINITMKLLDSEYNLTYGIKKGNYFNYKVSSNGDYEIIVWSDKIIIILLYDKMSLKFQESFILWQNASDCALAVLLKNNFIIAWTNNSNNETNIYAKIYTNASIFKINDFYQGYNPKVISFQDDSILIIWTCLLENGTNQICYRIFNSKIELKAQYFLYNGNDFLNPSRNNFSIAKGMDNNIIITWIANYPNFTSIEGCWYIYQNYTLIQKTSTFVIHNASKSFFSYPKIDTTTDFSEICAIVWDEYHSGNATFILKCQIIDYYGFKIGKVFKVNSYDNFYPMHPSVRVAYYIIFIVWVSYGEDTDGYGIYGKVFDLQGNLIMKEKNKYLLSRRSNISSDR